MRFRILGPLEVQAGSGTPVPLAAPKLRALLTVLLLHAGRPVSADRLELAVWPGRPPRSAAGIVRTYICGLRKALALGGPGYGLDQLPQLVREPGGYRLSLAPGDLDLAVFDDLSSRGRDALSHGDPARASALLADALALWRGEPASDVTLDDASRVLVAGLAERRLATEEAWADARLALGDGVGLIGRLRELAAAQPLRERARGQLMVALYRDGRKAEALGEFRELRRTMVGELGVEPSTPLQDLHRQILAGDPALGAPPARPEAARPQAARVAVPRQLPPDTSHFTGRDGELSRLGALLSATEASPSSALAIVTGTAGAGKTALAVRFGYLAADRFPDGQLFIDLRGHADGEPMPPAEALRRFLRAFGIGAEPADTDEATAWYRSMLAGKRMLILLDNAASASQVQPLLPGSSGCLVVVTSRSRLAGLLARNSATLTTVGPLTTPEGVLMLRKILGDSRVDAEPAAAAAIVTRCARLPLALRAAAERAVHRSHLTLASLAAELAVQRSRLDVLSESADRDTTVRSVLDWSYRALAPDAARAFRLLGLHPGPDISVPAAAALTATSRADATRLLDVLAGVHLVEEAAPGRYRCHDLLRAYAAERAAADETVADGMAAVRRVLTWYGYAPKAADRVLVPGQRPGRLGLGDMLADAAQGRG